MRELWIDLAPDSSKALYEQIYDKIRTMIADGKLLPGEKLPSTRFMAQSLSVSRSTVDVAYEQLTAEGYLKSRPRSGYFVCDISMLYQQRQDTPMAGVMPQQPEHKACGLRFSPFEVDTMHFPYGIWNRLYKETNAAENSTFLMSGDAQGDFPLRTAICRYLCRARGVVCREEQVIVGAGNEYLLLMLAQLLGGRRSVMMERYTYIQAYRTFSNMGYHVCAAGADREGICMKDVEEQQPQLVYVMPSHQFPLGHVMPLKRRLELLSWAAGSSGRYILEDDHDSEFRYKGRPIPALWGNDSGEHVIYLGTFSKSIAPSLRVSFMVLPGHLLAHYRKRCGFYSCTVPRVTQAVLYRFLEDGHFERHLNRMRNIYKGKHDLLLSLLRQEEWICRIYGEYAGLHVLAELEDGVQEALVTSQACEEGLEVHGLEEYQILPGGANREELPRHPATLLLGYGNLNETDMRSGIEILRRLAE